MKFVISPFKKVISLLHSFWILLSSENSKFSTVILRRLNYIKICPETAWNIFYVTITQKYLF